MKISEQGPQGPGLTAQQALEKLVWEAVPGRYPVCDNDQWSRVLVL